MKTRIIYLCLLVIFSTTGCISKNARKGINGNKNIVTRTIQVDDFEEIHLGSNIESAKSINPFNKKNRAICNYTKQMAPPRWRSAWTRICLTYWI